MNRGVNRERIERLCRDHDGGDSRSLRAAILDELRRAIPFDYHVFVLTDPVTCVGCDPYAHAPRREDLPQLIRLKYSTAVNRWTALGDPPVALLHQGGTERSLVWRELLGPAGIVDVASVVFRDRHGCWGFLDLWRSAPASPFAAADAHLLAAVAPAVTEALRRCQAATFDAHPGQTGRHTPLVLLLGPDLTLRAQTPQTQDYLRRLLPTPPEQSPIPAAAYNVAAQLVAIEAGVDDHPAVARVHLGQGTWVTLRAARMSADIVVTIENATPAERLAVFSRAFALSAREAELLAVLADGADTREAGARMFLSQHTVQDHLKSIFAKAGVRSRRELLARLL